MDAKLNVGVDGRGVTAGVDQIRRDLGKLPKAAQNVQLQTKKSFDAIKNSIFSIKGAVVTAFAGLSFASIIGEGRAFGAALGDLSAITGATGADLDFLAEKSRELGRTTTLTAVEAAGAFKLIASAKPDLLESGAALAAVTEQAVILAEATGQDLPTAAASLGAAMNQFGVEANEAARFINVLAAGSKFGAATVGEVSESLKFAGTVAADAGLSFEETVGTIETLSKVAIKGGEAGSAFRNILLALQKTGDRELNPAIVGWAQALDNLNKKQLSTTQLTEIFSVRSVVAAKAILNNVDSLKQLVGQVTDTNVALEQQSARIDNLDGDIKQLGSAVSDLKIGLQAAADEGLRELTQSMTEFFRMLSANVDTVLKIGKGVTILIAAFAGARILGPIFQATATAAVMLVRSLGAINTSMIAAQAGMAATIGTLGALRAAFMALGGPAGAILFAVGAVYAWITATGDAKQSADEYKNSVEGLRGAMANFTAEKIDATILDQEDAIKNFRQELADLQDDVRNAEVGVEINTRQSENLQRQGGAENNIFEERRQASLDKITRLRAKEQELQDAIQDGELLIAELQERRLNAVDPSELPANKEVDALRELGKEADALLQRGRAAISGVFPEEEEIARLQKARKEIAATKAALEGADPRVRQSLEDEGITVESLSRAYNELGRQIVAQGEKADDRIKKSNETQKAYTQQLSALDQQLALTTAATANNGKATNEARAAYETTEGSLKKLAGTQQAQALVAKAAALDQALAINSATQQLQQFEAANKMAALAQQQGYAITQAQKLQYELTEGSLKDLNDEQLRANLLRQAAIADDIQLTAEAEAIKDTLDPLRKHNKEVENLTRLYRAGKLSQEEFSEAMRNTNMQYNEAAQIIEGEFKNVFKGVINGTESVTDAFKNMAQNILTQLNDLAAERLGEQLFASIFDPGAAQEGTTGILDMFTGGTKGTAAADTTGGMIDEGPGMAGTNLLDKLLGRETGGTISESGALGGAMMDKGTRANPMAVSIVDDPLGLLKGEAEGMASPIGGVLGAVTQDNTAQTAVDQIAQAQQASSQATQEQISTGFTDVFADLKNGAMGLWDSASSGFMSMIGSIGSAFSGMIASLTASSAASGAAGGGGGFGEMFASIAGMFAGAANGGSFTVADGPSGGLQLPAFANGGAMRVGGSGGIDSQIVAFKASPNEKVTVTKPDQEMKNRPMQVNNTFVIQAPDGNVSERSQQQAASRVAASISVAQRRLQ